MEGRANIEQNPVLPDDRQATHWEGCWRTHHECAVALLDRLLADEAVGPEEARRLLADARRWAEQSDGGDA